MRSLRESTPPARLLRYLFKWLLIGSIVGGLAGSASAFFLWSLEWATDYRESHSYLIALLPLGGLIVGLVYHYFGRKVERGNNLILDEIHTEIDGGRETIPLRMMPLVLWGTVMTHFFGGSAGREGTAIQMGASLADQLGLPLRLNVIDRRVLLMAGMSAGFASVFGTPLAGAVFGLEVITLGRVKYDALIPCWTAAIVGNTVTLAWGIRHTPYVISEIPHVNAAALLWAVVAGAAFGITGMLFAESTHRISAAFKKYVSYAPLRPFIGGVLVAASVWLVGTTRYIGLGIPTIVEAFQHRIPPWDFAGKFAFTTVTLGAGFKGGEVTPLFYIGATLGNALAYVIPLAPGMLVGMGMVAVFAGAANTPIASTLMAIELFGDKAGVFAGVACVISYLFSGHRGIYHAQRVNEHKFEQKLDHIDT